MALFQVVWEYTALVMNDIVPARWISFYDACSIFSYNPQAPQKNCLLVLIRPTTLSGPTVKVFFLLIFKIFFNKIQNCIIWKRCWNCQQSIAHLHIGKWEFCSLQIGLNTSFTNIHEYHFWGRNTVAKMADAMDTTDACTLASTSKTWPEIVH